MIVDRRYFVNSQHCSSGPLPINLNLCPLNALATSVNTITHMVSADELASTAFAEKSGSCLLLVKKGIVGNISLRGFVYFRSQGVHTYLDKRGQSHLLFKGLYSFFHFRDFHDIVI